MNVYDYTGSNSRLDPHHLYYSEMKQEAIYLWVTTACILILSILLIVVYCCKSYCIGPRGRHVLVTLILMLMFAAAVVLILRYVNNDNLNESIVPYSNYSTFDIQRNWRGSPCFMQTSSTTSTPTTSWSSLTGS